MKESISLSSMKSVKRHLTYKDKQYSFSRTVTSEGVKYSIMGNGVDYHMQFNNEAMADMKTKLSESTDEIFIKGFVDFMDFWGSQI